jgi:histidinol-phosphate aminotransferase
MLNRVVVNTEMLPAFTIHPLFWNRFMSVQFGPDYVRAIDPYQGGKPIAEVAREFGLDASKIIKLASNENPLGMPESARQAMLAAVPDICRYPDGNGFELKAAITDKYGIPQDWITLGNGSNDILELAAHAFLQPGQAAIYAQYSFAVYALATQAVGARGIVVAAKNYGHDLAAMARTVTPDTRLIFIANPNNPTGTFIGAAEIEAFLKIVPPHVVVVLDEAYNEYLAPEVQYESIAWVRQYPNLLVSRTLSKAYGLAGLRVGFGIAQPVITDLLNRIRQPFNVNSLAQAAAIAALNDSDFLRKSAKINADGYRQLTQAFEALDLQYVPSSGNFVLVKVGNDDTAGARVNLALLKQGVIVRPVDNYGLPQWLRITIGLPEENAAFIEALKQALA